MTLVRSPSRSGWLAAIRRYLLAVTLGNLIWETAQLPLYTLWRTGSAPKIARAIVHCTLGDLAIATIAFSAGYTIYSEYVNTALQHSWAYTAWMPRLPWLGTGLSPLAQWLVVPSMALAWAGRAAPMRERS